MMNLGCYNYSDKEVKKLYKNMVIIIDNREKEHRHILDWLDKKSIEHTNKTLGFADYSFMVRADSELGVSRDLYFSKSIAIERKASLEELSGNLAQERTRFENELIRAKDSGADLTVMVEHGSMADILSHNYKTQMTPASFWGSVIALEQKYGIRWAWNMRQVAGEFIYNKFCYYLLQNLK
jgi:ERCC4-type nuclease